ncbi:UNKNOWN [Stylonychia lemnae]|uniref:Transmembrane protein n=1 Tax=Stylonychia lemnae TaxID=5949 RepID=A0A077ZPG7_STYLE|nr:UNKNOWN [Stylonychia lemnae]|eukprot:CDW71862.1 UNKNOWN [Stylonychia lemnae]
MRLQIQIRVKQIKDLFNLLQMNPFLMIKILLQKILKEIAPWLKMYHFFLKKNKSKFPQQQTRTIKSIKIKMQTIYMKVMEIFLILFYSHGYLLQSKLEELYVFFVAALQQGLRKNTSIKMVEQAKNMNAVTALTAPLDTKKNILNQMKPQNEGQQENKKMIKIKQFRVPKVIKQWSQARSIKEIIAIIFS